MLRFRFELADPSAGSGTYLVEAMKLITKEIKYKQRDKIKSSRQIKQRFEQLFMPDNDENKWAREYLYGSETNIDLGTALKVNMILHGDGAANIFVKDGLLPFRFYVKETSPNYLETASSEKLYNDKDVNGKFDIVVSNPPFSVDLDTQTQREVKNTFLFGDKKNSENLFIERYYQLLKEGGRLGVVLPESVFDTTENKYIRLFLFKYFNIKAVVSLPQLTFEPHTSTKTSLLFAQKKTKSQVVKWTELWEKFGKEWSLLNTRINDYNQYFIENKVLNKKWAKDVVKDIEENNTANILKNINRFLKDYITSEDTKLGIEELLTKYKDEIFKLSKYEKETTIFGFYNAWWVFGEVTKELDYSIFMAEAENIGYKRTKRGENPMPNDLYDLEYVPTKLDCKSVLDQYKKDINHIEDKMSEVERERSILEKKNGSKANSTGENNINKLIEDIKNYLEQATLLRNKKGKVENILGTYYKNDNLKEEYSERIDIILINHFRNGLLSRYKSDDILLRKTAQQTILDAIRQDILWD